MPCGRESTPTPLAATSRLTYHHGLLDQRVAVLTHVLQDLVGCIVTGCGGRLRSHCQGVDEGLSKQRNTCKGEPPKQQSVVSRENVQGPHVPVGGTDQYL